MRNRASFAAGVVFGAVLTSIAAFSLTSRAAAPIHAQDNAELQRLYNEDQADRTPPAGKQIDWTVVGPKDKAREARVLELYRADAFKTGRDYHNAAMILQHTSDPDLQLLGHELCIVAISKGDLSARWLCAATEDRFLMNINRPQRFATQYRGNSVAGGPVEMKLYRVDPQVTDGLRREFQTPTLAQAQERERAINELYNGKKP